jgi:hypothetical protein
MLRKRRSSSTTRMRGLMLLTMVNLRLALAQFNARCLAALTRRNSETVTSRNSLERLRHGFTRQYAASRRARINRYGLLQFNR